MIPWVLKQRVAKWLRRWPFRQRHFTPRYDLNLQSLSGDCENPLSGNEPLERAASSFHESPPFAHCFHSVTGMRGWLGRVKIQHPGWLQRAADQARGDLEESLALYGIDGPALGPGYPWAQAASGDILYRLRPHRFFFLPCHALASHHDPSLLPRIEAVIDDWCRAARGPANSVAFASGLLVLQRLLACHWAWLFIAAHPDDSAVRGIEVKLIAIMREDVRFLQGHPESSASNNHLLADRFAHWYCSTAFGTWVEASRPGEQLEARWLDELRRQVDESGWSFEASHHYHEFALDMALIYLRIKQVRDEPLAEDFLALLRAMLRVQVDTAGPALVECPIGDAIEDNLLPLGIHRGAGAGFYREAYRRLFEPALQPAPTDAASVEVCFWLLGGLAEPAPAVPADHSGEALSGAESGLLQFPASGIHVFADTHSGARMVFRSGPAGGSAVHGGHMHSDWLSVLASMDSRELLVDPGTYSYRSRETGAGGKQSWRDYFRSRGAHNTLTLQGGVFPPVLEGDFGPASYLERIATTSTIATDKLYLVEAGFDGDGAYSGYRRGVLHLSGEYFLVYDLLPEGHEGGTVSYQFAEGWELNRREGGFHILSEQGATGGSLVSTVASEAASVLLGSDCPRGGWVSTEYGRKVAAPQLGMAFPAHADGVATLIAPGRELCGILHMRREPDHVALLLESEDFSDHFFIACEAGRSGIRGAQISGRFGAVWLRRWKNGAVSLRGAQVRDLDVPDIVSVSFERCEPELSVEQAPGQEPQVTISRG